MKLTRAPQRAEWTQVYPGFSAFKSPHGMGYVRHDASGELHATPSASGPSADDVMMALHYAKAGEAAKAAERIRGYLVFCYGGAMVE